MTEYRRTKTRHFCDTELCMVIDTITGDHARFANNKSIGTLEQALDYVENRVGWKDRTVIVKLQCIKAL